MFISTRLKNALKNYAKRSFSPLKMLVIHVVQDLSRTLYAFHLPQIISTVLGKVNHGEQDGIFAQT